MAYSSYFPSSPSAQGYQGQQGANQTPNPNASAAQGFRGSSWTPAPASAPMYGSGSQTNTGITGGQPKGQPETSYQNSPVTPSGGVNYNQTQRWSQPQTPAAQPSPAGQSSGGTQAATQSLSGGMPQQQPMTTVPPTYADPFQAMGGGFWTGQQWVPRDHPMATQPQPGAQPGVAQPNPALYSPYGQYPGRPEGTVYQPGQMQDYSVQPYQPGQVSQWQGGPNMGGMQGQQDTLMQQLLASGGSLGPDVVNQMKEAQKQQALAMQQQMGGQLMQGAAARGSLNGGATMAGQRNLGDQTMQNILGGYRDIDINAAGQNYQDKLAALGASESLAQGRFGRENQGYQNALQGQMAQEGLNQQGFDNQMTGANFGRDSFLAQQGLNQQGAQSALGAHQTDLDAFFQNQGQQIQKQLGQGGLDMDARRLASQEGMFDRSLDLDWAQALNGMNMDRLGMGFNYAQLQQEAQNRMFGALGL